MSTGRAETLLAGEHRVLEMVVTGAPLGETLDALCHLVEQMAPEWLASILLVDREGDSVWHGAAPSLPKSYVSAIDGTRPGRAYGPCGLAARGEPVVVADIAADGRCSPEYRELAMRHGLRACWSMPIRASGGKVLGVFEIYLRQPGDPSTQQENGIEPFTHLASLAIERAQAMPADVGGEMLNALRRSEDRYARAMDASGDGHIEWTAASDEFFASPRFLEMCGLPPDATFAGRADFLRRFPLHTDDRDRVLQAIDAHFAGSTVRLGVEMRILRHGETRSLRLTGVSSRDAAGTPVRWNAAVTDITDRKRAEEEVRVGREELQRLMDSVSDYLWSAEVTADGAFAYRYYSPVVERVTGRSPEYLIESPERWLDLVHPLDRTRLGEIFRRITSGTTEREDCEYRILRPDGTLRWVRDSVRATWGEDGRLLLHGVVGDITDRKLAAEELRASEARFRTLSELSSDWYWEQDEELRFTYLSSQANDLTGYSGESSIGKTRWELVNMTPLSTSWPEHEAVLAARQPFRDLEMRRVAPDGTERYLSVSGAPVFDEEGRFRGYQGIGRNITERKRTEEALRQSEERFALAAAGANEGIFDWDLVTDRVYMSQRAQELYGLPPGEPWRPRREWRSLVTVHPDDAKQLRKVLSAHIADQAPYDADFRVCMPDGNVRWLRQRGIALRDASGKAYRIVGSHGDISDRKLAEAELMRVERQLRQAQRLEAMGTLAGGIAHDFNNILGAILGYGEMALRDAAKGSRLRRDLDSIMTAGERGRALVERILAFSRSSLDERVPVHVDRVAREALDQLAANLPANVTIAPHLRARRAAVLGDPTQVHQVLMNLATNAIQAMPSGGTLRVLLHAVRVDARSVKTTGAVEAGEYVVLEVADSGVGIQPGILERIFDPFFTTREVGVGTGLGLSLVHSIVTELGGVINVASTPGAGSTFTVYLPRAGDAIEVSETEVPDVPRGNHERVLVVDDEEPLVRIATETLEELGYRPVGFTSSAAALEAFRADPLGFDAVITDERMPGMSGSTLIRELRGIRAGIPTMLMSGFIGGAVSTRAREAGANEVLKKPLSGRELATTLARVLRA